MTVVVLFFTLTAVLACGVAIGAILFRPSRGSDIRAQLQTIITNQGREMAAIDDLQKAQAAEKADLATLTGLITQLLAAFANGVITAADASALLAEMNAEDSTVQSNITSIQNALTPPTQPTA